MHLQFIKITREILYYTNQGLVLGYADFSYGEEFGIGNLIIPFKDQINPNFRKISARKALLDDNKPYYELFTIKRMLRESFANYFNFISGFDVVVSIIRFASYINNYDHSYKPKLRHSALDITGKSFVNVPEDIKKSDFYQIGFAIADMFFKRGLLIAD